MNYIGKDRVHALKFMGSHIRNLLVTFSRLTILHHWTDRCIASCSKVRAVETLLFRCGHGRKVRTVSRFGACSHLFI